MSSALFLLYQDGQIFTSLTQIYGGTIIDGKMFMTDLIFKVTRVI